MAKRIISLIMVVALSMSMFMLVGCDSFDLNKYKEDKKTEIESYATGKGEDNYYNAEWQDILGIVENAKAEIDLAEEKSTVDTILSLAKEEINKVITKELILTRKAQAKVEIESYVTSKGEENYYNAEWQEILTVVENTKIEIDELTNIGEIESKVVIVKEIIEGIITKEQLLAYKTLMKTELENYAVAKGEENYNEATWGEINSIVEGAKSEIDTVLAKSLVEEKVTIAKETIDQVFTNEQLEDYKIAAISEIDEYHEAVCPNAVPYMSYMTTLLSQIIESKEAIIGSNTKEEVDNIEKEIKRFIYSCRKDYGLYREIDGAYEDGALNFEDLKDISYYYNEAMGEPVVKVFDETQKKYIDIEHTPRPKVELDYYTELFLKSTIRVSNYIYLGTYNGNIVFYGDISDCGGVYIKGYSIGVYLSGYFADGMGIYVYSK